jgi:hypothetical protein
MKYKDTELVKYQLCEGENVKIDLDKEGNLFISAPAINHTSMKIGDFVVAGNTVEIEAGRNVHLTTAHPNKLIIGCDLDKEKAIIVRLEKRIENLERVIAKLLKGGSNNAD